MLHHHAPSLVPVALLVLAGCATPYREGVVAAREGRYVEASSRFAEALAENPDRLDALIGLGVATYKLGAYDEAIAALERARERAPRDAEARLYLGLAHLRRGELGPADEHLSAFADAARGRRGAARAAQALGLLRGDPLVAEETRAFVAASLEDVVELEREADEARRALGSAEARYFTSPGSFAYPAPLCTIRAGRLRCF